VHILLGLNPAQSISNLLQDIKGSSSKWINEKRLVKGKFEWQEGYGAFTYSQSQIKDVIAYIENQEEHHKKTSFNEEYLDFLKKFEENTTIKLDPIYTGKMVWGIIEDYKNYILKKTNTIIAIHTGGLQGWHGIKC
jgi:hypothetical protein